MPGNIDPEDYALMKREFARRLRREMVKWGINQSELARAAEKHMPKNKLTGRRAALGRDKISHYSNGKNLPTPPTLYAIETALGLAPGTLTDNLLQASALPEITVMPDGLTAKVRMPQPHHVAIETSTKIAKLLGKDAEKRWKGKK